MKQKRKLCKAISKFHLDDWDCIENIIKLYYRLYDSGIKFYMDDRSCFDPPDYERHPLSGRLMRRRINHGILSCEYEEGATEEFLKEQFYVFRTLAQIVNNKLRFFSYHIPDHF